MLARLILLLVSGLTSAVLAAPSGLIYRDCATPSFNLETDGPAEQRFQNYMRSMRIAPDAGQTISNKTVNVYFHIIASEEVPRSFISDADIAAQMQVLNDDFEEWSFNLVEVKHHHSYFQDYFKNDSTTNFAFALFSYKKSNTYVNSTWFDLAEGDLFDVIQTEMKRALRKGSRQDMNVYTVGFTKSTPLLGYATLPASFDTPGGDIDDGIVLNYASLPNGTLERFNLGRTLTHEAGHWFGLYHTFDGGCGDGELEGDLVADTPGQESPTRGCPVGRDSCNDSPGLDPIENFMDYSDDSCYTKFSPGQYERMNAQMSLYRGF
ncbi:hypothetical protein HDV05_002336 [Chytridiales sp. JEL 0842]|nr:hypothetical protein HDV05_002336 [Chytridiales sp. JEL 0842]